MIYFSFFVKIHDFWVFFGEKDGFQNVPGWAIIKFSKPVFFVVFRDIKAIHNF